MKSLVMNAKAQGALCPNTAIPQKNSLQKLPVASSISQLVRMLLTFSFLTFILSLSSVFGQQMDKVDLNFFSYELSELGANGDTLLYAFKLGSSTSHAERVNGYDIDLFFPNIVGKPDQFIVKLNNSWQGDESEGNLTYGYDVVNRTFKVEHYLADSAHRSGHGLIFEVKVVRQGGFLPGESDVITGGGLVQVQNADFKRLPSKEQLFSNWSVYPNPARDVIRMDYYGATQGSLRLLGVDGTLIYDSGNELPMSLDISQYPAGLYFLSLQTNGNISARRLVIAD